MRGHASKQIIERDERALNVKRPYRPEAEEPLGVTNGAASLTQAEQEPAGQGVG